MLKPGADTYRRGLTLGLTMAEIFILILFLLLLLLLALYADNRKKENILTEIEKALAPAESDARGIETALVPAENNTKSSRNELPEEIQKLVRRKTSQQETIAKLKENTLDSELLPQKEAGAEPSQDELLFSKGIDPPCWYEVQYRQGKPHEKPYYLMDIAVHDEHLLVKLRPAPPGRGFELRGEPATTSYAEEHDMLPLMPVRSIRVVSLKEFREISTPIKQMGKNKQIRDYSCVFFVKVWDMTAPTAKKRWKHADASIKQSFYTYNTNEPWNHTDVAN